mgnify:CR=1 FL=1
MSSTDNPLKIIPVNFGVKYKAAVLGLEYYKPDQPQIPLKYEIPLIELINRRLTVD